MKRTLVLTLLTATMLPVASAATGDVLLTLKVEDGNLVATNSLGTNTINATLNGAILNADGSFTTASDNRVQFSTGTFDIDMNAGWTLQFDAKLTSATAFDSLYPVLGGLGESSTSSDYRYPSGWNFKIAYYTGDSDQKWQVDQDGGYTFTKSGDYSSYTLDDKVHTYTLTSSVAPNPVLTLYIDGVAVASSVVTTEHINNDVQVLSFGGKPGGSSNTMPATFSNVVIYEGVVTPAVPEPTTATLSLLALAGLAARRRRK